MANGIIGLVVAVCNTHGEPWGGLYVSCFLLSQCSLPGGGMLKHVNHRYYCYDPIEMTQHFRTGTHTRYQQEAFVFVACRFKFEKRIVNVSSMV